MYNIESDSLSLDDIKLCQSKNGSTNQLAFGTMLRYFKRHIRFPAFDVDPVPLQLIEEIAKDLELSQADILKFDWGSRTSKRFRHNIREYLGYREANSEDSLTYIKHLKQKVLPKSPSHEIILEQTRLYFELNKTEQFAPKQLKRYITSAEYQFEQDLFQTIFDSLNLNDLYLIDQVLTENNDTPNEGIIALADLKKDIPGARLKNVNLAIKKIELLNKVSLPGKWCKNKYRRLLLKYYDRIMALSPSNILEFSTTAKYATMAIFYHIRLQVMLDDLADIFVRLVHRMRTNAERSVREYVLGEVERVGGKFNILKQIATCLVWVRYPKFCK